MNRNRMILTIAFTCVNISIPAVLIFYNTFIPVLMGALVSFNAAFLIGIIVLESKNDDT